ncbi:MAG: PH domain-containing protein [Thermoleophilia bacterium]|nr:PH domain-containing protein [Thermoleophilia bacterium]
MEMMGNETMIWEGHPTWRAMLSFHVKWFAATLVLFGLLLLVRAIGVDLSYALIGAILLVGLGVTIVVGWLQRFFTQYTITTKRLNIRSGILSKTESSTNVDRIQNITVKQSPVDRIMKVGSIDFDTAGDNAGDRFSFIGVNDPQDLRERIMHARDDEKASGRHDAQGGLA